MRIGACVVFLLLLLGGMSAAFLDAATKGTPKQSPVSDEKADPYAVPDGDAKQLFAFLQKIAKQKLKNTELQAKRREAVAAVVEKILETKPDATAVRKLFDDVAKYFRIGPLHADDAKPANLIAEYAAEAGEIKLAVDIYDGFAKILAAQSDMSDVAGQLTLSSQMLRLTKMPFQLEGRLLGGSNLNWAGYRGKVVLVTFWATYCKACLGELVNIKANYAKYHAKGFEVVGISIDKMSRDQIARFVVKEQIPWANCRDDDSSTRMSDYYRVKGIPTLYLIGRDGKVAAIDCRGDLLGPAIETALAAAVAEDVAATGKSKHKASDASKKKLASKPSNATAASKNKQDADALEASDDSDALAASKNGHKEKSSSASDDDFRDWSDVSGSFHAKAKFRSLSNKMVKLELENEKIISVPLEKLSDDDRDYVRRRRK